MYRAVIGSVVCWLAAASALTAQQPFSQLVGNVQVEDVQASETLSIPFITWGGDVATFRANGGLDTQAGSIHDQLGLKLKLTPGDDFVGQVRDYVGGKTPFLRGTFRMLGQASEVLAADPRTKPVVILQLSFSAGDHIVARQHLKTLNDLASKDGKRARIACQQGGPHVGLLYDALDAAKIPRSDVEIVWVTDLTGPKGAAEAFRKDASIDACCVITPDMLALTGGEVGTGAEGTVEGAKTLVSTQQMSRSIADVYAVRGDWFRAHRPLVEKFVAGYLKATDQLVPLIKDYEESGRLTPEYRQVLTMAQNIFGKQVLPTLEVDAHGLLLDCSFVGLPGQVAFFQDRGNLNGFERKMSAALDLATSWGYADARYGFDPPGFDYQAIAKLADIRYREPRKGPRFEGPEIVPGEEEIVGFTITFDVNDPEFSTDRYGSEFGRALQAASTFGNALVVIRGHADPTHMLGHFVRSGMQKGLLKRTGTSGNYRYFLRGKPLDITRTEEVLELIRSGAFEGREYRPQQVMQAALNLSQARADAVKAALVKFAERNEINLDASQIKPVGVGVSDPVVPKPTTPQEAAENRRVEFLVVPVPAEAQTAEDFDF